MGGKRVRCSSVWHAGEDRNVGGETRWCTLTTHRLTLHVVCWVFCLCVLWLLLVVVVVVVVGTQRLPAAALRGGGGGAAQVLCPGEEAQSAAWRGLFFLRVAVCCVYVCV